MGIRNAMEKARKAHRQAVEQLYEDTCTIYEYKAVKDEITKLTSHEEVQVLADIPCKISFERMETTTDADSAAGKTVSVKLFVSSDINITPGSKIVVEHLGEKTAYSNSGVPGRFPSHQEIELKLFERWA